MPKTTPFATLRACHTQPRIRQLILTRRLTGGEVTLSNQAVIRSDVPANCAIVERFPYSSYAMTSTK